MLVNKDLFEKEGLSVPTTYQELVSVCKAFSDKGYTSPMMGYSVEEKTSIYTLVSYPFFCSTVAGDAEAVKKLNDMYRSVIYVKDKDYGKLIELKEKINYSCT